MRILATVSCALALTVWAQAPRKPPEPAAKGKSAFDKATLEAYLRHLELWPAQVEVKIGDPKPFLPGLMVVNVHLSSGAASRDVPFYLSADGKTILRGDAYNIDRNPFQPELDGLNAGHQPEFGPASAPLTLVVFSDFECPVCREEAKELRERTPAGANKDLRVVFTDFPLSGKGLARC